MGVDLTKASTNKVNPAVDGDNVSTDSTTTSQDAPKVETPVTSTVESPKTAQEEVRPSADVAEKPKATAKKTFEPTDLVEVTNNSGGKLVYVSRRSGNTWVWETHGDFELMEVQELISMRSSARKFFEEQWITIEDEDVLDFLRVKHFFKTSMDDEDLDTMLLEGTETGLMKMLDGMKSNDKSRLLTKARQYIESGSLTDYRIIEALEERFGTTLK